jgi:AbrB family looped-hinge helix DNA binding protein
MEAVTLSRKFQIVIPRGIREALRLKPGQRIVVLFSDDRIELIPIKPIRQMRGFLAGIDTGVPREREGRGGA